MPSVAARQLSHKYLAHFAMVLQLALLPDGCVRCAPGWNTIGADLNIQVDKSVTLALELLGHDSTHLDVIAIMDERPMVSSSADVYPGTQLYSLREHIVGLASEKSWVADPAFLVEGTRFTNVAQILGCGRTAVCEPKGVEHRSSLEVTLCRRWRILGF